MVREVAGNAAADTRCGLQRDATSSPRTSISPVQARANLALQRPLAIRVRRYCHYRPDDLSIKTPPLQVEF
jgi:hypothetical protein